MRWYFPLCLLIYTPLPSQVTQPQKPSVSFQESVPQAVPRGSCKENESGYLEKAVGDTWRPYTSSELGEYFSDRLAKGYVVKVYPQPNGRLWVEAICAN